MHWSSGLGSFPTGMYKNCIRGAFFWRSWGRPMLDPSSNGGRWTTAAAAMVRDCTAPHQVH